MKKPLLILLTFCSVTAYAQLPKVELYDLIKKFAYDSTGYETVGDWAVSQPKKFPVKWKENKITMSDDTAINFYRMGNADIAIKGEIFTDAMKTPVKWNIMLKGPRMGYSSFTISSTASKELSPKYNIDSLFGNKPFTAKLIKTCDNKTVSGYYYYEVKIAKKDPLYIKFSWLSVNGSTTLHIDAYDSWSRYAVKLDCPR